MMGPPKETNLKYEHEQLPNEEVAAGLSVQKSDEQGGPGKKSIHLVSSEEIEEMRQKKIEQENKDLEIITSINEKLIAANLDKVTTTEIQRLDYLGYKYICKNIKDEFGITDWEYVRDKFSPQIQEKFKIFKKRTFKSAIFELRKNLLNANTPFYSAKYIEDRWPNLHEYFRRHIRNKKNEVDWDRITNELNDLNIEFKVLSKENDFNEQIQKVKDILSTSKESLMPSDISIINPGLYGYLRDHFRHEYGYIDWDKIKSFLPAEVEYKLKFPADYFERKYIAELDNYILTNDEPIITLQFLKKHAKGLLGKLIFLFKDRNGELDANRIYNRLSEEAKKKFKFNRTKDSALKELNELLKEKNPKKINSRYIKGINPSLFGFIQTNFRNAKGNIDWQFVVNHLSNEFRSRFEYPVRYNRELPDEKYDDDAEITRELGENKKYIYTFIKANRGEEMEKREEICKSLIKFAKKGNEAAERQLLDYLSFRLERWIEIWDETKPGEKEEDIYSDKNVYRLWKFNKDEAYEIIKRCIYNYRFSGSFIGYVQKSLQKAAFGLQRYKQIKH